MSSHWEWAERVIAQHYRDKPFAPENGEALRFSVGDPVIYTNVYGVQFKQRVTGLYQPSEPCSLYATGRRYFLNKDSYWMPVAEAELELDVSRQRFEAVLI